MSVRRNPVRRATALRYDRQAGDAPEVTAPGSGTVAERIIAGAQAAGVPVR